MNTIDPRLPQELTDLLDAHEIPHTVDALLWEIEKRGYFINMMGAATWDVPAERWYVNLTNDDHRTPGKFEDQTARIALARAFQWIVNRG